MMAVYIGGKKAALYRGDYRPAAFYRGANKIAGWHDTPITAPVTLTGTYNDTVKGIISGNSVLQADWAGKEGLSSQVQTVQGKNLLNTNQVELGTFDIWTGEKISGSSGQSRTKYSIPVQSGQSIVYSTNSPYNSRIFVFTTSNIYLSTAPMSPNTVWTASQNCLVYIVSSSVGFDYLVYKFQYEYGATPTAYEPYYPGSPTPDYPSAITSSIPAGTYKIACPTGGWWVLPLDDDLRGIGDYKDKIELDLLIGKGNLRRSIHRRELKGTESWSETATSNQVQTIRCSADIATVGTNLINRYMITHFKYNTAAYIDEECSYVDSHYIALRVNRSRLTTDDLAGFKAWIAAQYAAGTPVTFDYVRATELVTPLTLTHVDTSDLPELTLSDLGITSPIAGYPFTVVDSSGVLTSSDGAEKSSSITVPVMSKVGSIADTLTYSGDGVWSKTQNIGEIASYAGETIAGEYISSTGGLDTGAKVKYQLDTPITTSISLGTLKTYPRKTDVAFSGGLIPTLGLSAKVTD